MKISDCEDLEIEIAYNGKKVNNEVKKNSSPDMVTLAHLAQYVDIDTTEAEIYKIPIVLVAYEALEDEFGPFEKLDGYQDRQNNKVWMKFKDGSMIKISERKK